MNENDEDTILVPIATKHGGRAAMKSIKDGKPFTGLAKTAETEVKARLAMDGVEGELRRNAINFQVVSDLYFPAFVKTLEEGNLPLATEYLAKWGWNTGNAVRTWLAVLKLQPKDNGEDATEILAKYRTPTKPSQEAENGTNN